MNEVNHHICFVGESYVHGTGDPSGLGWVGRTCSRAVRSGYRLTAYNLGVRRDTSLDVARRWEAECRARLPVGVERYIVFSFGTNDTAMQAGSFRVSPAQSAAALTNILARARELSFRTLFVSPPPVADVAHTGRIRELTGRFAEVCAMAAVPFIDVFTPLLRDTVWQTEVAADDAYHPGCGGYERLSELVVASEGWFFRA